MTDEQRIFVAVDISDDARMQVASYIETRRQRSPDVRCRWVAPKNLHITACFIGNVDADGLTAWQESVSAAADGIQPFNVELAGTGRFSQHRQRTDVLWLGVSCEPRDSFDQIGLYLNEDKRVKPHLTIGRLKNAPGAADLLAKHSSADFGPISFRVTDLVIYESKLTPSGSIYTQLYIAKLKGRGATN